VKGQILADFLIEMPGDTSQAAPAAVTQEEPWTLFTDGSLCMDGSGAGLILTNPEGVEFTYALSANRGEERTSKRDTSQAAPAAVTQEEPWTLFTDGSLCMDGSGAGLILTNPKGVEFTYALRFQFTASNNEAEYEALVAGLRIATQIGVKNVQVNVDSKLVANQVLRTYVAKEDNMIKYLEIVKGLVNGFTAFSISQVPRSKNKKADALSKITSTSFAHLSKQMTQLVDYLKDGALLGDDKEARKLRLKARQYELMDGVLYKRSFLTLWLRCVGSLQADYVMREIHEGSRRNRHSKPISGRAGESQIFYSRHGLLYEVDRSKGSAMIEEEGPTWMTELVNYLKEGILSGNEKEARKLRLKARQYELM
nr:reverse transcriptase domain-containing protein [Tanacetum cinerariifolium]